MKDDKQGPKTVGVDRGIEAGPCATPGEPLSQTRVFHIRSIGHNRHPLTRVGRFLLRALGNLALLSIALVLTLRRPDHFPLWSRDR